MLSFLKSHSSIQSFKFLPIRIFRVLLFAIETTQQKTPKVIYVRDTARNRTSNYLNTEAGRLKH